MGTIKGRVQARMEALGLNSFEVDRRAGLKRGFTYELLEGRKKSVRQDALPKLAFALECDPGYLTGAQASPRTTEADGGMKVAGFLEAGVWREPSGEPEQAVLPILPDPRFPAAMQQLYLVQNGPHQGAAVTVLSPAPLPLPQGAHVVVRRVRDEAAELSLRTVEGDQLVSHAGQSVAVAEAEILGVVVAITKILDPVARA